MAICTFLSKIHDVNLLNELHSNDNFDNVKPLNGKPSVKAEGLTIAKTSDSLRANAKDVELNTPILTHSPNLYKQTGDFVSKRFIKLNLCEAALWLMANYPNAYLLLNLIALRAQRTPNHPSGLQIGEAFVGDYEAIGATRKKYRTALATLVRMKYITIIETCRNRKKSATGTATKGTKVSILNSDIWDINIEIEGHQNGHRWATEGPPMGHEQEGLDKIDDDLIDLGKSDFDPKTTLRFRHKKTGSVEVSIQTLKSELLIEGWSSQEIYQAIHKMQSSDPELSGTIKRYITTILTNERNQQEKEKKCPKPQKKNQYSTETPSNSKSPKDKGYYSEEDMSEAPLAKFARLNGLK